MAVGICYDQQIIIERKTFHIQTKSGFLGLEGFLPSPPVIMLYPSPILCTTDAHATSEDHIDVFAGSVIKAWAGKKSVIVAFKSTNPSAHHIRGKFLHG